VKNDFLAVLMLVMSAYCVWTVIGGLRSGTVEPITKAWSFEVERTSHPRWFWVAVTWNALWAAGSLFIGLQLARGL